MDKAWDSYERLAIARGMTTLARAIRYGIYDETDLLDRQMVRRLLAGG